MGMDLIVPIDVIDLFFFVMFIVIFIAFRMFSLLFPFVMFSGAVP